jgi:hypothetical protein
MNTVPGSLTASSDAARVPWRAVLAVLAVIAVLTGGWPLLNSVLADGQPLPDRTALVLGPSDHAAIVVPSGGGWVLSKSSSNPQQNYLLHRGGIELSVDYVSLSSTADAAKVWPGITQLVRLGHGHLGTGEPSASIHGNPGETATLRDGARTGSVTSYIAPDRSYAVRYTVLGSPAASAADRSAAEQTVRAAYFQPDRS